MFMHPWNKEQAVTAHSIEAATNSRLLRVLAAIHVDVPVSAKDRARMADAARQARGHHLPLNERAARFRALVPRDD